MDRRRQQSHNLRDYQKKDVDLIIKNNGVYALFNEQRTGKTPTAIVAADHFNVKTLVITTASSIFQWQDEINKWSGRNVLSCVGSPKTKELAIKEWTDYLIICIHSLKTTRSSEGMITQILKAKPEMVILDEAHQIRNVQTCQCAALFRLSRIKYRLALTGTPAYGTPQDVWSILHWLHPEKYTSKYNWMETYMIPEQLYVKVRGETRIITKYERLNPMTRSSLLKDLSQFASMRKRKDVLSWLPPKDIQTIALTATQKQKKYLKELSETFETEELQTKGVLDRLIRYRQITASPTLVGLPEKNSPKTEWILHFIEDNPDTPMLIFSEMTSYLTELTKIFKEKRIKYALICGAVDAKIRAKFTSDFQSGKFNVFLLNTIACKEALTLDRAEAAIFATLYPPIGAIEQAEDRFIATTEDKKDKPHTIYRLALKDTFDESILRLLQQRKNATDVINNFKEYMKGEHK